MIPAWQYSILEKISHSEYARISLVITNASYVKRHGNKPVPSVFRIHQTADKFIFARKNDYSRTVDAGKLLNEIPGLKLRVSVNGTREEFADEDVKTIRKYSLDVILKFGFGFIGGDILKVPELGVWAYSIDNYGSDKNGTTGYYEVAQKSTVTASQLVMIKDERGQNTLLSGVVESTCPYSVHLNKDRLFRRASLFIPRVLEGIYKSDVSHLEKLGQKYKSEYQGYEDSLPPPLNLRATFYFAGSGIKLLRQVCKKVYFSDPFSWILLFRINGTSDFLQNSYGSFKEIKPSRDKFWADPFVVSSEEKYFVFVEEFIYSLNKGHIAVLELDNEGKLLNSKKIIERPYHLSYPFVFETKDGWYMIPESGENRTIDLYKSVEFPDKWIFVKHIMTEVNAVDTTLFNYKNKWWLFTIIDKIDCKLNNSPELYLFYSDDILSENWISHPLNPVVADVRRARPAGRIFISEGKIYRPGQDCSGRYGQAFSFNEVIALSETDFEERQVLKVNPDWKKDLKGTHTFNFDKNFTIIDAYTLRRRTL